MPERVVFIMFFIGKTLYNSNWIFQQWGSLLGLDSERHTRRRGNFPDQVHEMIMKLKLARARLTDLDYGTERDEELVDLKGMLHVL